MTLIILGSNGIFGERYCLKLFCGLCLMQALGVAIQIPLTIRLMSQIQHVNIYLEMSAFT